VEKEQELDSYESISYDLIKYMRKAQSDFFDKHSLEGAYWCVDLTVYEMDDQFKEPIKKIVDQEHGYSFKRDIY
jgi:hypothetical protein